LHVASLPHKTTYGKALHVTLKCGSCGDVDTDRQRLQGKVASAPWQGCSFPEFKAESVRAGVSSRRCNKGVEQDLMATTFDWFHSVMADVWLQRVRPSHPRSWYAGL